MVLVIAMKLRATSSFPCSAKERVCRSWEGAQPGSSPKLDNRNVPYHRHRAQFMNGGWPGILLFLGVPLFSRSSTLFFSISSNFFGRLMKSLSSTIAVWGLAANRSLGSEKELYCVLLVLHTATGMKINPIPAETRTHS